MTCTEIRVFSLCEAARNRLGVSEAVLDLPEDFSVRLSKDVERLSILGKISTEGALGFSAPFTETNDAIFIEYYTPLAIDNRVLSYRVAVLVDGHTIRFDRLVVKERLEKNKTWELELRRSPDHWIELASTLKLNQIDFGISSTNYLSIETSWADGAYSGVYDPSDNDSTHWPLIDYGNWVDLTEPPQDTENRVKRVSPGDIRPLISLPYILKRGFCQIGWTIEGVIFDAEWFRRLWVYALKETYYDADTRGGRIRGRSFTRRELKNTIANKIFRFLELIKGNLSELLSNTLIGFTPAWTCGIKNTSNVSLRYKFIVKGEFHNDRTLPFTAVFQILEIDPADNNAYTGEVLSSPDDAIVVEFVANQKKFLSFEIEATLGPNQKGALGIGVLPSSGFFAQSGLYFEVVPVNKCIMHSAGTIVVADCLSDQTTLLDWIKVVAQLTQANLEPDFDTKTLTIHPRKRSNVYGTNVPGFLLDENPAVDLDSVILPDSIKSKRVRLDQKRYTRLSFADSTDAYIESLSLSEPAHSRRISNGDDLVNDIEEIQNQTVEPTLEGGMSLVASDAGGRNPLPAIPRMWDNTNQERSFVIGPRILFSFGLVRQKNPDPKTNTGFPYCGFYWDNPANIASNIQSAYYFGYATQLRTLELDPAPAIDGSVVFGSTPNDLFTTFYLGITQEKRFGFFLDVLMRMKMADYNGYNFRDLYKFQYNGRPIRAEMIGIRDFAPCLNNPTPVTFFVNPQETECCDLPCGCQFSTCEYYQDFGIYLRQETLNEMRLASFIVDGIELITSPLAFGELQLVDIGGDPFVANLVTLLSSIGAPYFSFSISTSIHPQKGRRFFKITRPACTPFKILITQNGDDAYLYTQNEQKQNTGTWQPLGYGDAFYSEPIGCQIVTQY